MKEEKKEQREPCRGRRRAEGGDTNWGVGGGSSRGILVSLSVWIEETLARRRVSGVFVFASKISTLTREAGWRRWGS